MIFQRFPISFYLKQAIVDLAADSWQTDKPVPSGKTSPSSPASIL